jgi:HPt (histidine-containing phosphotransfer) domain-containing protein
MPVLDGFDATLAIREWEHQQQHDGTLRSPIVIIALTASTLEQDWGRALSIGMNDYLIKPIYKEVLSTLLDHWQQVIFTQSEGASTRNSVSNSLPHLDLDHLHRLSDNQPEFELELLKLFWEDNALHLKTLQQAIDRQDFSQIQRSAHHIKGASASVGAKRMQFLAEQLENQSYPASGTITAELMAKLEFSLAQIGIYLKQWEEWGMGNG